MDECRDRNCNRFFLSFFKIEGGEFDTTAAVKEFKKCREHVSKLSKNQRKAECLSEYIRLHNEKYESADVQTKWQPEKVLTIKINGKEEEVCSQVYIESLGFTLHRWKSAARSAKKMSSERNKSTVSRIQLAAENEKMKSWTDDDVFEFTLAEAEEIMKENVPGYTRDMPRCSICPNSDKEFLCIAWLLKYFETFGDKSPTSDEIKLSISHKFETYNVYKTLMQKSRTPVVKLNRFYVMWDSLFPLCVNRPWCDIPGKCDICYQIDQLRKSEASLAVQKALQYAHLLHRYFLSICLSNCLSFFPYPF